MRKALPYSFNVAAITCSSIVALYSMQIQASGFALIEQSVSGMGTAYAGSAAQAQDATTIYFNPAGLTHLKEPQAIAATHIVVPQAEYDEKGSTHALSLFGVTLGTEDGGDAGDAAAVPNLYYARKLPNGTSFGLGINVPFGLSTEYNRNWIGRYHAVKSEVHTVNINPAIAFKATDQLSVGLGFNLQYIEAELTNAIDFGLIDASLFGGAFGLPQGGAADGFIKLKGSDWSAGYNLGVLYDFNDQTRFGLHYRSKVKHTLEGKANFTVPGGGAIEGATGLFIDTDVESTVSLPGSLSASIYHDLNNQWAIMADITWTEWSRVKELRFEFENPVQADGVTSLKWEDTYRYSAGITHTPNDTLTYRAGIAYDETPIPNSHFRSPRVPGADRLWLAIGLGYKYSSQLSFDIGYAHLFVNDARINKSLLDAENAARGNLNGKYDASVDMLSAQLKWIFM